jgi:hypothetical protein
MKKIIGLICLLLLFAVNSMAAQVTLQWNPADRAAGYKVYYGIQPRNYIQPKEGGLDAKNTVTYTFPLPQENDDQLFYFAITAYNQYGESEYSEEVSGTVVGKHLASAVPTMNRITVVYDSGEIVDFDIIHRTTTTTKPDGTITTGTF